MQLFALNESNELVSPLKAIRQKDYTCPECRSRVRVRSGTYRTPHFFHLDEDRECRQNGKSLPHLQTQFRLQQLLPQIKLERPFPSISRIADAAWEEEKIVFEVQCSPITAEELKARNRDYASVGWTAIWIFHEDRYNKRRLTAAEWAVRQQAHYFTDIDDEGAGNFYAHFAEFFQGTRKRTLARKVVSLTTPTRTRQRLHFIDDGWEAIFGKKQERFPIEVWIVRFILRIYISIKAIFYHYFEKSCR